MALVSLNRNPRPPVSNELVASDPVRFLSGSDGSLHISGLVPTEVGQPGGRYEKGNGGGKQTGGEVRQFPPEIDKPSIKFRFFLALSALFVCFALSLRGWQHIYNEWRRRGGLWLSGGGLIGALGLGLFWLSRYPASCGWLL